MSGLAAPDASLPEKIASFALPLAAGAAAAIHPAGARGLAGLTSGVNTMLATREFGRRERSEQEFSRRLSDLIESPTGVEMPTGRMVPEGTPAAPGSPEEEAGQGALMPEMRQQRLSDVLGATGPLVKAMTAQPGFSREAAALLASQIPKPQYHVIQDYDAKTGMMRPRSVDISKPGYLGTGTPFLTYQQYLAGEQAAQGGPPSPDQGIPEPPAGQPPAGLPPGPIAEGPPQLPSAPSTPLRATPKTSTHYDPSKGTFTVNRSPGEFGFEKVVVRGEDGRNYNVLYRKDPVSGNLVGQPVLLGEAPSNDKQAEIEGRMREFPGLQRGTPDYWQLYGELSNLPTDAILQADTLTDIRRRYGRYRYGATAPQSSAPESAPTQPRAPAPSAPAYSPTQRGVIPSAPAQAPAPTEGPIEPPNYQAIQERGAQTKARQAASQAGQVKTATEQAEYDEKFKRQKLGPAAASQLQLPGGGDVDPEWTMEQATAAKARKVNPSPEQEVKNFTDLAISRAKLDEMARLVPDVNLRTIVGGVRAWANTVAQTGKVGPIPIPERLRKQLTPEQNRFLTIAYDYADAVARLRSGANIPLGEFQRMLTFLISPEIEPGAFVARLGAQQDILRATEEARAQALDAGGYKVPRAVVPSLAPRPGDQPILLKRNYGGTEISVGQPKPKAVPR